MVVTWEAGSLFGNEVQNGTTVSNREFAAHVGVRSENSVRKWLASLARTGQPSPVTVINGRPRLILDQALALWAETHPETPTATDPTKPLSESAEEHLAILRLKRADLEFEQAKKRQQYIHRDEIKHIFEPMIMSARNKIRLIEDRMMLKLMLIADENRLKLLETRLVAMLPGDAEENRKVIQTTISEIGGASEPDEYRRIIRRVINETLTELSEYSSQSQEEPAR